jgi:hypothetical protein
VHTRAKPINLPRPRLERSVKSDNSDAEYYDSEDDTEDDSDDLIPNLPISGTNTSSFKSELGMLLLPGFISHILTILQL